MADSGHVLLTSQTKYNIEDSNIAFPSKITIMAYIGTYFALGSSWFFTLMNYFLLGWFNGFLDHYYSDSFRIYVAIIAKYIVFLPSVVFVCVGTAILRTLTMRVALLAGNVQLGMHLSIICRKISRRFLLFLVPLGGQVQRPLSEAHRGEFGRFDKKKEEGGSVTLVYDRYVGLMKLAAMIR